jgi:hypothetical protein
MAQVANSYATELLAATIVERLTKGKPYIADRQARPFAAWLESKKEKVKLHQNKVAVQLMTRPSGSGQTWSGDVTLNTPTVIRGNTEIDFTGSNYFDNHKLLIDELANEGIHIQPNGAMGINPDKRFIGTGDEWTLLDNIAKQKGMQFLDRISYNKDIQYHRVGASPTDIVGLAGLLPLSMTGNLGGLARSANPILQHSVFAGISGGTNAANISPSGTTGASGTLLETIQKAIRQCKRYMARSGLPMGGWRFFGGEGFLDKLTSEYRRIGVQWNKDAAKGGQGGVDMVLLDEDIKVGRMPFIWDPTLSLMDDLYSSDQTAGVSQLTVTFSGGGGSGAKGVAYVNAAGTVTSIIVTDPGSGYTSQPTCTLGNVGGGTGATNSVSFYKASAGTGAIVVDADDTRIGQVASVTVTAPGSGYPTTGAVSLKFTDCAYLIHDSWCLGYPVNKNGIITGAADDRRKRDVEVQYDSKEVLVMKFPRANAVIHAA